MNTLPCLKFPLITLQNIHNTVQNCRTFLYSLRLQFFVCALMVFLILFSFEQVMTKKAKKRIVFASLYLGTGPLEKELVWCFAYLLLLLLLLLLLWTFNIVAIPMVTMAQSAANWRNTHTHMDRTHSLTHLQLQHSYSHVVWNASLAIIFQCLLGLFVFS